jgi:hypothetical protein
MRYAIVFSILTLAIVASTPADCDNVKQIPSFASLRAGDAGTSINVNVSGRVSDNDGGGGEFVQHSTCEGEDDDGVRIAEATSHKCWYRQFTGPVHLRWYGVQDATSSTCLANLSSCAADAPISFGDNAIANAFAAAKVSSSNFINGDGGVVTDGLSIVVNNGDLDIPKNQYFSCNGPPGASRDQSSTSTADYWLLPNSIVLNPAYTVHREEQSRLSSCIIRPIWYNYASGSGNTFPANVADTVQMMHQFTGTATTCDGEACNMDNMLIIGFDTCDETTKQRSILSNLLEECMVNEWIHDNGGGMKLQNIIVKQYIEGSLPTGLDHVSWPITFVQQEVIAGSGTGRVVIRIDIGSGSADLVPGGGDTVLIDGLGLRHAVSTTGKLIHSDDTITDIPGGDASGIIKGDAISDSGASSGCIPTGTVVNDVTIEGDGTGTVTASNLMNSGCVDGSYGLKFSGTSVAPVGGNGRWLTDAVTNYSGSFYDVTLVGALWAGPSDSSASWKIGIPVITVLDTTNIIPGQYVCASGTPPFCSEPSGFGPTAATLQTTTISDIFIGTVQVSGTTTTVNWPLSGIAKIVTAGTEEDIGYTVRDGNHIDITLRHLRGTSAATHNMGDSMTAAAPVVIGVVPTSKAVVVSAPAQSNGSGTVVFGNDTLVVSGTGIVLGQLTLNPGYHTWTANTAAGGAPSAALVAIAATGSSGMSLSISKNCWKVLKGMGVIDLTNKNDIGSGITVNGITSCNSSTGAGVFGLSASIADVTGDSIQFIGCGMPDSTHPWLGNCASTSLLAGGGNDLAQGVVCEYFHSFGNQIQIHTIDAPATSCTNSVLAGGGGLGDQIDPDSVALWLDGDATKTQFTNGRIAGATTSILDTPDKNGNGGGQADGVGLSNIQIPGNIILGPDSNAVITGLHGHPAGALSNPIIYAASLMLSTQISSSYLPQWPIYFDDNTVFPKMYCSGNSLATPLCNQVKTTPACISSCTSVSGSDSDFDILVSGTNTSITVQLAANYPTKPICRATASTTSTGAAASASVSVVTLQSFGTAVTFKTSAVVSHIYGSCHSATG